MKAGGLGGKLVVSTFGQTVWTAVSDQTSPQIALDRAFKIHFQLFGESIYSLKLNIFPFLKKKK